VILHCAIDDSTIRSTVANQLHIIPLVWCWRAGVLGCWRAGVLACWGAGVLACWDPREISVSIKSAIALTRSDCSISDLVRFAGIPGQVVQRRERQSIGLMYAWMVF
jgi:hypothetical protein